MADVTIAIPSFRRPKGLARLLDSLAALDTQATVRVLVGDNDAQDRQAFALCARLVEDGYRWPLRAIIVSERGIAQNRSALVADALHEPSMDYLAMLDDDEFVEPHWLEALIAVASRFDADAVEGPVAGVVADGAPARDYAGVARHQGKSGPVAMLEGGGNMLLSRRILSRVPAPHFDPAYGLSGGEDRDFFIRLAEAGARFAWCAEAACYTDVPLTRQSLGWILMRAYANGNADMRIFLKHHEGLGGRLGECAKILIALVMAPIGAVALSIAPRPRTWLLRRLFRACGKAAALVGVTSQEYVAIHGE